MIFSTSAVQAARSAGTRYACGTLSGLVFLLIGLLAAFPARAEDRDSEFLRIHSMIQDADALDKKGETAPALAKYRQAEKDLKAFRLRYPDWEAKVAVFRANYLNGKITALTAKLAPPPGSEPANAGSGSGSSASSGPKVKLLEAGGEPRKTLRLHPKEGDKQTLSFILKLAVEVSVAENKMPAMKMPPIKMVLDYTIKAVGPDGTIHYEFETTDASVEESSDSNPQVVAALKSSFEGLKGATGKGTVSDRGFNKNFEMKLPAGADPSSRQTNDQMKESLANISTPLPEEPVGVGAKWQSQMTIKSQGMNVNQTSIYELVSVEDDACTVKVTISQNAANQKISNPAMPGLKMDLTKLASSGGGESKLNLAGVTPLSANVDMHSDMDMSMNNAGQKQAMSLAMDVSVKMETK